MTAPGPLEVAWDLDGEPLLGEEEVRRLVSAALEGGERPGVFLSLVFVDDATLAGLHGRYLDDPSRTDVMAFDLGSEGQGPVGEVYVSVERARDLAAQRGVPPERELALYLIHGVLHLCGHDDHAPEERERMRAAERAVLERLDYPPDTAPHDL